MNALVSGETDMMFDIASIQLANVRSGKLRALAVAAPARFKALPDVPTLAVSGVKDAEVLSWFGIVAPKGTPPAVIATLDRVFKAMSQKPEFQKAISDQGLEPTYMDANRASVFWRNEIDK